MSSNSQSLLGMNPNIANIIEINSEEDAWKFLEQYNSGRTDFPDDIIIGNWVNINITLKGEKWQSSLTPSIFPVFDALQRTINRAYAESKYGNPKKRLTNEEKEKLEIIIKVSQGSSIFDASLDLIEIAKASIENMESRHILISIIAIALTIGGTMSYKAYLQTIKDTRIIELNNDDKQATLEAIQFLSEQETVRFKNLEKVIQDHDLVRSVYEDTEEFHNELLRSATKADSSIMEGVELDIDLARELIKSKKVKPEPLQINGFFQVKKLEWHSPTYAEITLIRMEDGLYVKADFDLSWFNNHDKEVIKNAEWDEDNPKIIKANINARITKDGKITSAELVRVKAPSADDYNEIETSYGQ